MSLEANLVSGTENLMTDFDVFLYQIQRLEVRQYEMFACFDLILL
jgi:uncharacterized protein YbbC (DUF1343 family)